MRAARQFVLDLENGGLLQHTHRIKAQLYGSLALTGLGHATDRAILLGLAGEAPETIDPATIEGRVGEIREHRTIRLLGSHEIHFDENGDLLFHKDKVMPGHSNTVRFTAFDESANELASQVFYSVGGGFISREGEDASSLELPVPPYPFSSADRLLQIGDDHELADLEDHPCQRNHLAHRSRDSPIHRAHMGGYAGVRATRFGERRHSSRRIERPTARSPSEAQAGGTRRSDPLGAWIGLTCSRWR